jgi:hypothetical protein
MLNSMSVIHIVLVKYSSQLFNTVCEQLVVDNFTQHSFYYEFLFLKKRVKILKPYLFF